MSTNEFSHPTRNLSSEEHWLYSNLPTVPQAVTLTLPQDVVRFLQQFLREEHITQKSHEDALTDACTEAYSKGFDDGGRNGFDSRDDEVEHLIEERDDAQELAASRLRDLEGCADDVRRLQDQLDEAVDELNALREQYEELVNTPVKETD